MNADAWVIGVDPVSGKPMTARLGRYGPFVQIGSKDDPDGQKPKFASLKATQRIERALGKVTADKPTAEHYQVAACRQNVRGQ